MYGKFLRQLKDGTLKLNRQAIRDEEKYDGKYLLRTSDDTLTPVDIALGYKQLVDIEDAFKCLKSTLVIRPMFHRLEDRIRAHVMISWLALVLVRITEIATDESWRCTRDELQQISLGHFQSEHGDFYQNTELTVKQKHIFSKLELTPPPGIIDVDLGY